MIHLILGGRRSGKSAYAENVTLRLSSSPYYLATSRIWDDDHRRRVDAHRQARDRNWTTIEEDVRIDRLENLSGKTVLLEDISLWLTNIYMDCHENPDHTLEKSRKIMDEFVAIPRNLIVVSSEAGLGIHPETKSGRDFADILGLLNQDLAQIADAVDLVVAGIPVKIKEEKRGNIHQDG